MKIGITIPNYYKQFLDEIANLNNSNKTAICSLIVENFLSYNKRQKKFPLFRKDVRIVFANEVSKSSVDDSGASSDINDVRQDSEQSSLSRDEIIQRLKSGDTSLPFVLDGDRLVHKDFIKDGQIVDFPEDPEDDGFPFQFDSED